MKPLRLLTSLAVIVILAAAVHADDTPNKRKKGKKAAAATRGQVEKVDTGAKTITLRMGRKKDADAKTVTVVVNDQTKYVLQSEGGEKSGKLSDVTVGKPVMVTTETKAGKDIAVRVVIPEGKRKKKNT